MSNSSIKKKLKTVPGIRHALRLRKFIRKKCQLSPLNPYYMPKALRIEACTLCQLRCAGCWVQRDNHQALGGGYLTFDNFKKVIDDNPQVERVELSNYGEIFLNPDLIRIMEYAFKKKIMLTASNGVNFNTVSDEQIRALVDYQFRKIHLSIDGATQGTYAAYRIGGDIDCVLDNVRKLLAYKKKRGSSKPEIVWKYILMAHNELEVGQAKRMAAELGIPIIFSLDWTPNYKPVNVEYLKQETGFSCLTRESYEEENKEPFDDYLCRQIYLSPQINWDGRLLGCCFISETDFGVNVFDQGLKSALRSDLYRRSKECLLKVHPDPKVYGDCPCYHCPIRLKREQNGKAFRLDNLPWRKKIMNTNKTNVPKVSVVVPVWNPGQGVSRCIESLRSQTLEDIEIIFVDDCGTDGAMEKIRKAAAEDPRIRIIENEKNIGPGPSRNKGIETAKGEYLSFIDPDDYVEADFLEKLYEKAKAEALDIVKGIIIREKEDGTIVRRDRDLNQVIRRGLKEGKPLYLLFTYEHHVAIYRKDMLIANAVRYGSTRRSQDTTFLLAACLHANSFALIEEAKYHLCERSDSAMHTMNAGMLLAVADGFREKVEVILSADVRKEDAKAYLLNVFYSYIREPLRYEASNFGSGQTSISEALQKFIKEMAEQVKGLPFCEELAEKIFSIRALLEYGVALPQSPYVSPWENATPYDWRAVIKKWADFLETHPECRDACRDDVRRMLARVYMLKSKSAVQEAETQVWKNEMKELMTEIKRFPKWMRTEVYLRKTARALIPDSILAAVKRMRRIIK